MHGELVQAVGAGQERDKRHEHSVPVVLGAINEAVSELSHSPAFLLGIGTGIREGRGGGDSERGGNHWSPSSVRHLHSLLHTDEQYMFQAQNAFPASFQHELICKRLAPE